MSIRTEPVSDAQARALIALSKGPVYPGNGISRATAIAMNRKGLAYLEVRRPTIYTTPGGRTRSIANWILHRDPPEEQS
jgi:hypothetical protein